jgi:uncharacterized membrane protein YgdD (TMEM256/DUF423 family)
MKTKTSMQTLIILAGVLGALGVGLGAFGAHALEATLEATGRTDTFRTGTMYHLVHVLAILGAAWVGAQYGSPLAQWAGYAFVAGIVFFSGSLYVLSIFDISIMGAVAPIGGTAFIAGWLLLVAAAVQSGG